MFKYNLIYLLNNGFVFKNKFVIKSFIELLKKLKINTNKFHPYQILDYSPRPLFVSLGVFLIVLGLVLFFHEFQFLVLLIGFFQLVISINFLIKFILFSLKSKSELIDL